MLKLRKIAVTGSVSCGKTTVCGLLQKEGAYYISTDEIVHKLLLSDTTLGVQLTKLLGKEVLVGGSFSKDLIAEKVFKNPELLRGLEKLLHPLVLQEVDKLYQGAKKEKKHPLFVVEIPLLYEIGEEKAYDRVIFVTCKEELIRQRKKDFTKRAFEERKKRFLSSSEKEKKADFVIENNEGKKELTQQVKKIYQQLLTL